MMNFNDNNDNNQNKDMGLAMLNIMNLLGEIESENFDGNKAEKFAYKEMHTGAMTIFMHSRKLAEEIAENPSLCVDCPKDADRKVWARECVQTALSAIGAKCDEMTAEK